MAALLVRLKLTLLRNSLRRSVWRTVGLVIGMVYALAVVVLVLTGLVALRWTSATVTADVTVVAFALLSLGWLLLSLLVFGVDETIDPARFALLPVRARELMPGLLLAGLISSPGVATALVGAGLVVTWARAPGPVFAAVLAVPIGVATCFLLSRTGTAAFASVLGSRRFRDFAFVALAGFGVVAALGGNLIGVAAQSGADGLSLLHTAAVALGWTPFGWAWAVPADVALGHWVTAGLRLVLAVALLVGLWLGWAYVLDKRLTEPVDATSAGGTVRARGLADRLYPATPAGAVAARTLRYWRRDPRYLAGVVGLLIAPVVVIMTQLLNPDGQPAVAAFAPVLLCWLVGISVAQDLSYDGSALWLHAASGIPGADDRTGRVLSALTIFVPQIVVLVVAALALSGEWRLLVPVVALSSALTLASLGVGSVVGAIWQWPAPPPGTNPFQQGSSGGLPALASLTVTSLVTLVVLLPTVALVVGSFWVGWLGYVALPVGLATGVAVLVAGIRRGGAIMDRRWPEVLTAVSDR